MRLEKAYRDMGHDIDSTDTPLEAGLGFAVAWDKPGGFVGRDALLKQRESGPPTRRLVNVLLDSPDLDLIGDEPVYWDGKPGRPRPQPAASATPSAPRAGSPSIQPRRSRHRRRPGRRLVRDRHRRHPGAHPGLAEAVLRPGAVAHPPLTSTAPGPATVARMTQRHLAMRRSRTKPNSSNRVSGPGVQVGAPLRLAPSSCSG